MSTFVALPDDLPAPQDDGAANHLAGMKLPDIVLPSTAGVPIALADLGGLAVCYVYPKTGQPGKASPAGWDEIPGARGCTPQSCAFRDHYAELQALGVNHLFGISTQSTAYQSEAKDRLHLPFDLLSDADGQLRAALNLPHMVVEGETLLKRMAIIARGGTIAKVFYPVFPPDGNAHDVLDYLSGAL